MVRLYKFKVNIINSLLDNYLTISYIGMNRISIKSIHQMHSVEY